jgi:hypothetical protein
VVSITLQPLFIPGERNTGIHCTGGCVDPIAGLDTEVRGKILYFCLFFDAQTFYVRAISAQLI